MMKWLRDKLMWLRLITMRYFLSRKEQESVVFVKGELLHKKIFSDTFDNRLTDTKELINKII